MADYVVTQRYEMDNAISAGADAATTSLNKMADAADKASTATETSTSKVTAAGRSWAQVQKTFDAIEAATVRLTKARAAQAQAEAAAADAVAKGNATQEEARRTLDGAAAAVEKARINLGMLNGEAQGLSPSMLTAAASAKALGSSHDQAGISAGAQAFALRQLGVQSVQAFSSIASGQPIFTTLVQQGHQVVDVAMSTGAGFGVLGSAARAVTGALFSIPGATVAVAAGLAYAAYSAEETDRAMVNLQTRLRATRDDYAQAAIDIDKAARTIAAAGITNKSDALTAATIINSSASFTGSATDLQNLVRLSADVARAFDEGIAPAAGRVAAALKSPKDAAQALADQGFRGLTQSTADFVARLQDSGQMTQAQSVVMGAYKNSLDGAASEGTKLERALQGLTGAFTSGAGASGGFIHDIGEGIAAAVALGIDAITALMNKLDSAYKFVKNLVPGRVAGNDPLPGQAALPGNILALGRQLPTDALNDVYSTAERLGMRPELADFSAAIAQIESGGQHYAKGGGINTSPAGALGLMQVMPGTGAPGLDLTNRLQNIEAGEREIMRLDAMFGGDYSKIAVGYNAGPGRVGTGKLPLESSNYLGKLGLSAPAGNTLTTQGEVQESRNTLDQALKMAGSTGSTGQSIDQLQNKLDLLNRGQALTVRGSDDWQKLQGSIESTTGALYKIGDPIQLYVRGLNDSLPPLAANDGASRQLAEAMQQLSLKELEAGRSALPAERLAVQEAALTKLSSAYRDQLGLLSRQADGQGQVLLAYDKGSAAVLHATNQVKAEEEARKVAIVGSTAYNAVVADLTQRYDDATRKAVDLQTAQQNLQSKDQLEYIDKERSLIGATVEERDRELAVLKERQRILAAGGDVDSKQSQAALDYAARIADGTSALRQQNQAIQDLSNMATQAFDQVGQAISNAFVGGTGSAVNFGNVARSVLTSVLQQVVKLAVINPILNSVFGASNTTLSGAIGAVTNSGNPIGTGQGGGGSSVSISDLLGLGKSAYSAFGDSSSSGGILGYGKELLGTQLWGGTTIGGVDAVPALYAGGANGMIAEGAISNAGVSAAGGTTLGSLVGGIGLGYGAGSLVGGLIAGNSPARQTNAQIGAAGGAIAGAAIGSIIPGVGTVIGGLVGGLVGGGGGGLIGPGAPHHGYSWAFQGNGNQLSVDNPMVDPTMQGEYDAENQQVAAINQYLAAQSLQVSGRVNVGGNNNIAWQKASLNAGFGDLRFGSTTDSMVDKALSGKSFASATDLQNAVTAVQNFEAALPGLLDPLNKNTTSAGTLQTALDGVNTTYTNAITQAQSYGRATDDLAAAQVTASQAIRDAADKSITTTLQGFTERALAATSGGGLAANLLAFDDQAQQQRDAFSSQLTALYGDAYKSTASYTQQTLTLEQTLSAERLKISQQYYDQGRQQVLSVVQSLTSYTRSLALSAASPLSAQDQYAYATNQFSTTSSAALNGDFTALQGLQGSAQDFLTASRNLNGSGLQYARDYEKVTAALAAVAGASSDQLTASAMASIQRSTTDQLTQALGSLGSAVTGATLTNGDAVSSSIYASLNSFSTGLVAATNDNTEQLIANFRAIANSISASSQVALDEAALSRVQDYQTGRMLVGMDAIRAAVEAVTAEIRQQGSAPASYASAGGNGGSADIYGR